MQVLYSVNNYYLNQHPHPWLLNLLCHIHTEKEKRLYILSLWLSERERVIFVFPAKLLNNPNLDGSENILLTASFRDIRGTAAREKKR